MDRIATFKSFISRSPSDPFPRYGLAMEYKSTGALEDAWATFSHLLERFPDYVPSYLMAGGTLASLGQHARAGEVYRTGIAVAGRMGDQHARKELEAALAELPTT